MTVSAVAAFSLIYERIKREQQSAEVSEKPSPEECAAA
jgi:hypothetical protein